MFCQIPVYITYFELKYYTKFGNINSISSIYNLTDWWMSYISEKIYTEIAETKVVLGDYNLKVGILRK